jgi:hypothetical protein
MTLSGIIFDMDGTLVDSGLDFDAIRRDIGLPEKHPILEGVEAIAEGPERDRALEILHRHEHDGAMRATPFPGVADLLGRLVQLELRSGVLTRNSRASAQVKPPELSKAMYQWPLPPSLAAHWTPSAQTVSVRFPIANEIAASPSTRLVPARYLDRFNLYCISIVLSNFKWIISKEYKTV